MSDIYEAIEYARKQLGFADLKDKQLLAIKHFVEGSDTFAILPTGYGKSVIYSLLPVVFDRMRGHCGSIVVCVSPLTSLMIDQKSKLLPRGLKCEFVGEAQTDDNAVGEVLTGKVQLVFISPENLLGNPTFRTMFLKKIYKDNLVALVIDEAHCGRQVSCGIRYDRNSSKFTSRKDSDHGFVSYSNQTHI
ncbi:uncharacterized protein LOC134196591 [Corticium candelabrum]|uniref:uncharacterized protein LOC134196591 n=1 Tax=Corticium candelabrum TaxID=121492 RepID=UPI002E264240|nr:uncharacterized protein LOC134196591 [Corticium candelabrum]